MLWAACLGTKPSVAKEKQAAGFGPDIEEFWFSCQSVIWIWVAASDMVTCLRNLYISNLFLFHCLGARTAWLGL